MTTTVEVKFDGSTWTDVKAYVRRLTIGRGRPNDLSAVDPGTLTVELDNNDGRFTPTNTQGAYSPNVKPAVEVRVTVNAGAGPDDYRLFTGKAQRWEPRWDVGGRPIVVLEAIDGFEQLANFNLGPPHVEAVQSDLPDAHWTLAEPSGDFLDNIGSQDLIVTGSPNVSIDRGESASVALGAGAVKLSDDTGSGGYAIISRNPVPEDTWSGFNNDITVCMWVTVDAAVDNTVDLVRITRGNGPEIPWKLSLSGSALTLTVNGETVDEETISASVSWTVGQDYLVAFHIDQLAPAATVYRDGVSVATASLIKAPVDTPRPFVEFGNMDAAGTTELRMSETMLWTSDATALLPDVYSAGRGWRSDTPGDRIGRVLDWAGWDAIARDLDVGTTPLAAVTSGSALSACQDAAAADGGVFFIDANGNATFQGRRGRWEDPAAIDYSDRYVDTYGGTVVDFDDDGTDTGYQTIGWRFDTTLLANRVTVNSNTQGTSDGVAEDDTSKTAYGLRTLTISTISNNSADNAQRADWELSRRKDPHLRLEEVGFLVADTVQEDAAGALELQSLVEVNRRPGAGQDDLSVQMRVASIDHTISDGGTRWQARFGLLEADTDQPGVYGTAVYGTDYYGY